LSYGREHVGSARLTTKAQARVGKRCSGAWIRGPRASRAEGKDSTRAWTRHGRPWRATAVWQYHFSGL